MKKGIKTVISILALSIISLLCGRTAFAVEDNSTTIVVSPTYQNIILVPGEVYRGSITVSNPDSSKRDLYYSASVGSFQQVNEGTSSDDYGNVDTSKVTAYNQIMDWITFDKKNGVISPNNKDTFTFTINVPKDAPAGGQYATILFTNDSNKYETDGTGVGVQNIFQFASIIYAEVAGTTRQEGAILENNVPSFLLNGNLEATARVKNNGNVHTDASFILQIWPLFSDEEICTNEENATTSLIMPETERYHTETCNLPPIGLFRAKQTVKIFGEESIVEKTVIVCPLWLIFVILFVVIALIIWIIIRMKSRKKA